MPTVLNIVLVEPEIPPNTGNVIRLCANTGSRLHLVRPLGFTWDDRRLKRAGLDYHEWASVQLHDDLPACLAACGGAARAFAFSTQGNRAHSAVAWQAGDIMVFGAETRGLSAAQLACIAPDQRLRIPMVAHSRSMNLANSVAVALYEGWRQLGYAGAAHQ